MSKMLISEFQLSVSLFSKILLFHFLPRIIKKHKLLQKTHSKSWDLHHNQTVAVGKWFDVK